MSDFSTKGARAIAGLAALTECLNIIGREGSSDHQLARIVVDNELNIRALMQAYVDSGDLVHGGDA